MRFSTYTERIIDFFLWSLKTHKIKDAYYWIKHFLFHRYDLIRTRLNKGRWYDTDTKMLYGMMNLLVDYVEKEKCFEIVEWDADPQHQKIAKEIKTIYNWWKNYENTVLVESQILHLWSIFDEPLFNKNIGTHSPTKVEKEFARVFWEVNNNIEDLMIKNEQKMLIRLIKIRRYLWT